MKTLRSTPKHVAQLAAVGLTCLTFVGIGSAANAQSTATTSTTPASTTTTPAPAGVAGQSDLTLLAKALAATGLDAKLKTGGPYTIFAPSDLAFGVLPSASIESLLKADKKDELTKILLQHVVKGSYGAGDLARSVAGFGAAIPRVERTETVFTRAATGALVSTRTVTISPPAAPVPSFAVAYPVDQFVDRAFSLPFSSSESNPSPGVFVTLAGTRISVSASLVQEGQDAAARRVQRLFFGAGHVVTPDLKSDGNIVHKIDTVISKA